MSGYYFCKKNRLGMDELIKYSFRYGLPGSSDIMGILDGGKIICIEVKTGGAKQSALQKNFQKMITKLHGIYIVAKSIDDVVDTLRAMGYDTDAKQP